MTDFVLAGTGHRPDKIQPVDYNLQNDTWKWVARETCNQVERIAPKKIISGMALGFDQLLANIAVMLDIPFIAAVPFVGQESQWPTQSQAKYHELLEKAEEVIVVSDRDEKSNIPWLLHVRNEWMVDHSDLLLALWDGSAGGTKNCVSYALRFPNDKYIIRIDPVTKKIGRYDGTKIIQKQVLSDTKVLVTA